MHMHVKSTHTHEVYSHFKNICAYIQFIFLIYISHTNRDTHCCLCIMINTSNVQYFFFSIRK